MLEVPFEKLTPEVIDNLIDYFVLREGTDYGNREFSLEEKRAAVIKQLKQNKVLILYDSKSDSCNIVTREEYNRLLRSAPDTEEDGF